MNAYLRALQTDPRFVACMAAILPLVLDDVPQPGYSTFWDPGGALMLSLVFADGVALAFVRRNTQIRTATEFCKRWWLPVLLCWMCKYCVQVCFYVRNAVVIDSAFLVGSHVLIACMASPQYRWQAVLRRVAAGSAIVALSVFLLFCEEDYAMRLKMGFRSEFVTFALMRVFLPYAFWTTVLSLVREEKVLGNKCGGSLTAVITPPAAG